MKLNDQIKELFNHTEYGTRFSYETIVNMMQHRYGVNLERKTLNDHCYSLNQDINKTFSHYLLNLNNEYIYVGDDFTENAAKYIIEQYKINFSRIDSEERYKWVAVGWYKKYWDIDALDFTSMFEKAFKKFGNILATQNYLPYQFLCEYSKSYPEETRALFKMLYDELIPLEERFNRFRNGFSNYLEEKRKNDTSKNVNHYQDLHAISVYLSAEYPEKYFIYKSSIYNGCKNLIFFDVQSEKGMPEIRKLENNNKLCSYFLALLKEDHELLEMSRERLTSDCDSDAEYHMLSFDVVYFARLISIDDIIEKADLIEKHKNAWLLTWNPDLAQDWPKYAEECEYTQQGNIYQTDWNCSNKNPEIGDDVYMMKLGGQSRFLIGHGIVSGKAFYRKSWDGSNKIVTYISVDFDKLLNYQKGEGIKQEDLINAFPDQKWSPQSSGISIQNKYTFELKKMFNEQYDKVINQITLEEDNNTKNMILYGPPGTGKTYCTVIHAVSICDKVPVSELKDKLYYEVLNRYHELESQGRIRFITFHQSYGYEEFIEGIKPVVSGEDETIGYKIVDGLFKQFCSKARKDNVNKPYVLVIDEINRGNISKIFGELITLIEETKREKSQEKMSVILPYSGDTFSVPNNVYIIGTMNTADRSIALLDVALRRRFQFIGMYPDSSVLSNLGIDQISYDDKTLNIPDMLDIINKRIEYLADRDHTIGHAYFTSLKKDMSMENLAEIFRNRIIPLLEEYFFNDYEKIRLVLGDNNKPNEIAFIQKSKISFKDVFNGGTDFETDLPEYAYSLNEDALMNIESYKQIGKDLN